MKYLYLSLAFLALGSSAAEANFNGSWLGKGSISDNHGMSAPCEKITIQSEQTDARLVVNSTFFCGTKQIFGPSGNLDIRNGEIFNASGAKVGLISENEIHMSTTGDNTFFTNDVMLNGNEMSFKTVSGDHGLVTTFEGTVVRQ